METMGFTTVSFRDLSRREICQLAYENDVHAIEWGGDVHLPPEDLCARKEVVALQKEFGIRAISYGTYYELGDNDRELWQHIIDTAEEIGAGIIRIWQGKCGSDMVTPQLFDALIEETRWMADMASKKGLTIAFEFHKGSNNDCGEASVRFMKAIDRPNVKTYWQPLGRAVAEEDLAAVLPYLISVHVFYWNDKLERFQLKSGEKRWKKFISMIREAGISANYIMEFVKDDSKEQFARDVKTLKRFLKV